MREYAAAFGCVRLRQFIETGTHRARPFAALHDGFDRDISVELGDALYDAARRRFSGMSHFQLLQGDSGELMPEIVEHLQGPALFWLDAHYSGDVTARGAEDAPRSAGAGGCVRPPFTRPRRPCRRSTLFQWRGRVTLTDLRHRVLELDGQLSTQVADDIIRIHA